MVNSELRVLIVDDEETARITLRRMLDRYCPGVQIVAEAGDVIEGAKLIKHAQPQVVFLDIRIGQHTGFDLLELLTTHDFQLVFVTAYDEYAVKAFEVNAIDYLLKPIAPDRLQQVVKRCQSLSQQPQQIQRLKQSEAQWKSGTFEQLVISNDKGHHYLQLQDLIRISSDQGLLYFWRMDQKPVTLVKNIGDYEKLLPKHLFFRSHQSHLINKNWISSYLFHNGGVIGMKDGTEVPLARSRKEAFNEWIKK